MTRGSECSRLVLVPTALEQRAAAGVVVGPASETVVALCGFGPIAAAARTAALIEQHSPTRVVLVGIAGTYDPAALRIGQAACFREVALHGIGAGTGGAFASCTEMGFAQWTSAGGAAIDDRLPLAAPATCAPAELLLTCCAASSGAGDVADRRARFPQAVAEDMEGFGVALACAIASVPLSIVRGISNVAGDRDKENWRIDEALRSASVLLRRMLEAETETTS